jgi:hypothetical protein
MRSKLGRDRPRVSQRLPHPSWNIDKPILFTAPDSAEVDRRLSARRIVTPEEIWAVVDAARS